jgi:hypothetical protein
MTLTLKEVFFNKKKNKFAIPSSSSPYKAPYDNSAREEDLSGFLKVLEEAIIDADWPLAGDAVEEAREQGISETVIKKVIHNAFSKRIEEVENQIKKSKTVSVS